MEIRVKSDPLVLLALWVTVLICGWGWWLSYQLGEYVQLIVRYQ